MKTPNILKILLELQKRRQGYLFGGPLVKWCGPEKKDKNFILIEETKYSGCKKYSQCTKISDKVKWNAWNKLEPDERLQLEDLHCYRASKHIKEDTPTYTWDNRFIDKRIDNEWKWVGNPFGIRNNRSSTFLDVQNHRDIKPCPFGGCITPEMQALYNKDIDISNVKNYWGEIKACPFYFKSKDESFETFEKNIARFAQCYATQKEVIDLLKENGFITASTLFRDIYNKNNPDMFWYPFFSGYSYIQLPYLTNKKDIGWDKFSPQLRWHATTIQRLSSAYLPNTKKIFTSCEEGSESSKRHAEIRFIDICDGYASWMLLTWIIIKRIEAAKKNNQPDIKNKLLWEYAEQDSLFSKLENLGFKEELSEVFKLESIDGKIYRNSTLEEDLDILGLGFSNEQKTESRFNILILWLQNITNKNNKTKIEILVGPTIKSTINNISLNYEDFINDFIIYVNCVIINNNDFIESFILNPPVHIIVRAFLTTPIRWCFIPINTDLNDNNKTTLTSGIIVLIEDSTESKSYKPKISNNRNIIMNRFNIISPLLSAVNNIEEQNLRDEEEKKRRSIEDERERYATRAAISQVMARNMSHNIGSHVLSKMVSADSAKNKFPLNNQYISSYENIYTSLIPSTDEVPDFNLANFNSYLRTRMDFLADIATGEPSMETTCLLVRDIIGEMDKNRILLNNISGVENFNYTVKVKDCRKCEDENCDKDDCCCNSNGKDIPVSIPNGIMGYHALYVIIENIIRNTAKHQENSLQVKNEGNSEEQAPKTKEFTLEIRTSKHDDTLYEVWLYDNISKSEVKQLTDDEKKFFKDKTRIEYDNSLNNNVDWLVFEQNTRLNNSVINSETSRLREGAWGLIEMDASSAYLRKLAPEKIDDDIYNIDLLDTSSRYNPQKTKLNILKAINKNGRLGYRFHMLKPKEMLIVDEKGELYKFLKEEKIDSKYKLDILRENGIWVLQTQDNKDANYFDIEKVYPHPFMLIVAGDNFDVNKYLFVNGDETDLFRGNLPNKIIVCKNDIKNETENPTPWVAYITPDNKLITYIQNADKLVREKIEKVEDIQKNILMDLVWQIWLENKMRFHKISIRNVKDAFEKKIITILPYLDSNFDKKLSLFRMHHPNKKTYNEGKDSDFILGYPSSVKEFIENSLLTMDKNENTNSRIDKINTSILADCIFNKILIFDERIQASWEVNYPDLDLKKHEFLERTNLICPSKTNIDLNVPTYSPYYKEKIFDILKKIEGKKLVGVDFIVIHLGVIEKILTANGFPKNKVKVKEFISEIQNCIKPQHTRVVITSGRGKPDNLPEEVPFISFSTLSQYSIETPFKPFINQIIQSARTFKQT